MPPEPIYHPLPSPLSAPGCKAAVSEFADDISENVLNIKFPPISSPPPTNRFPTNS